MKAKLSTQRIVLFFIIFASFWITFNPIPLVACETDVTYEFIDIPCPSLGDVVIDFGDTQEICVLLPRGYSSDNSYPTVYFLPGWMQKLSDVRMGVKIMLQKYLNDTIVVIIDGYHELLTGVMYQNSHVMGYS